MKSVLLIVGGVFVSSFAFAAQFNDQLPSGGEVPAVRKVALFTEEGCGVPPPADRDQLPCPSVDRVTFEVETVGACDLFTTQIEAGTGGDLYLTIVKQKILNCTRPQHAPRIEAKTLILADELRGSVRLGNPLIVETHFRQ